MITTVYANARNAGSFWSNVAFSLPTNAWTLNTSTNLYEARYTSNLINATSIFFVEWDYATEDAISTTIAVEQENNVLGVGAAVFYTKTIPSATVSGHLRILARIRGTIRLTINDETAESASVTDLLHALGMISQEDLEGITDEIEDLQSTLAQSAFDIVEDESGELYLHCYTATDDETIPYVVSESGGEYSLMFRHTV